MDKMVYGFKPGQRIHFTRTNSKQTGAELGLDQAKLGKAAS